MIYVTMSLDLHDADAARPKFNAKIQSLQWKKLSSVDTVWVKEYSAISIQTSESTRRIFSDISSMLVDSAKEHKIPKITYIVQIGNSAAFEREVYKDQFGTYKERAYSG